MAISSQHRLWTRVVGISCQIAVVLSCGPTKAHVRYGGKEKKAAAAHAIGVPDPTPSATTTITPKPDEEDKSAPPAPGGPPAPEVKELLGSKTIQVKSIELLRSSIETCVGTGRLAISNEMIINFDVGAESGKVRFLDPSVYRAGDNILEKEHDSLVDPANSTRTGAAADSLSSTILRSLEVIGGVVAANCDEVSSTCLCSTKATASAMLNRCLPWLSPGPATEAAATALESVCRAEELEGRAGFRVAIASLIASMAFAASR